MVLSVIAPIPTHSPSTYVNVFVFGIQLLTCAFVYLFEITIETAPSPPRTNLGTYS